MRKQYHLLKYIMYGTKNKSLYLTPEPTRYLIFANGQQAMDVKALPAVLPKYPNI